MGWPPKILPASWFSRGEEVSRMKSGVTLQQMLTEVKRQSESKEE